MNKKQVALLVGGVVAAGVLLTFTCCGGMWFWGFRMQQAQQKKLDGADALWKAGKKDEAVAAYKGVIKDSVFTIEKEDRPTVFQRVIEYDMEQGDTSSAKSHMQRAAEYDVVLAFNDPKASGMWAEVKGERDAQKRLEKNKEARKKITDDELKGMSLGEIEKLLGPPDERYQSRKRSNVYLYAWEDGSDKYVVVTFIRHLLTGEPSILTTHTQRTKQLVQNIRKAIDEN